MAVCERKAVREFIYGSVSFGGKLCLAQVLHCMLGSLFVCRSPLQQLRVDSAAKTPFKISALTDVKVRAAPLRIFLLLIRNQLVPCI
ncbi:hypothetical protein KC19_1G143700 [Ceratodon purpureus]|uniref:Uncharacterized protein n=1 Tax=Ceratodon purpureus TaxID=3225 RepID=A0A8T0J7S8_CERPU|nr:hypothetical protein KC19_1G143700 [Ceratodon purpureus]